METVNFEEAGEVEPAIVGSSITNRREHRGRNHWLGTGWRR